DAIKNRTSEENNRYNTTRKLLSRPDNMLWAAQITDALFRSHNDRRTFRAIKRITAEIGTPSFLPPLHQFGLQLLRITPSAFASIISVDAKMLIRKYFRPVIQTAHPFRPAPDRPDRNYNSLGEAVLGPDEATEKQLLYIRMLETPNCNYISVKISSIVTHLNLLDRDGTIRAIKLKLRPIYRAAMAHKPHKTVTLDMEEYRDLRLTVSMFMTLLSEPEFFNYRAGIVLQAYVPDTNEILEQLIAWATHRVNTGGAKIRIRIVKGANQAMEQVESEISRLPYPLFRTKTETDANFIRLILACTDPEASRAIDLGIATHNIFGIAFALWIRAHRNPNTVIEMLQGMADDLVRVLVKKNVPVLVYTPLVSDKDYSSAVAYLIRRLDENSGPQHFLGVAHSIVPGDADWIEMEGLFRASVGQVKTLNTESRRIRRLPPIPADNMPTFSVIPNGYIPAADTDWTQEPKALVLNEIRPEAKRFGQ
ncbi:hypothetical protein EBR96_08155, partial [bacterium]|nr:hypothetical protein [bacterium]